ncbi:unnamed protein product [Lasius platythorax]|uniref:Uncharacterized protein n=1 Tax=Lasius platythorax TaxID=488582 RepID=A0AAV2N778_9HYME
MTSRRDDIEYLLNELCRKTPRHSESIFRSFRGILPANNDGLILVDGSPSKARILARTSLIPSGLVSARSSNLPTGVISKAKVHTTSSDPSSRALSYSGVETALAASSADSKDEG